MESTTMQMTNGHVWDKKNQDYFYDIYSFMEDKSDYCENQMNIST